MTRQQLCTSKKSTIKGHRKALQIAENQELIKGFMPFVLGVIFLGRSACKPAQRADKLTIFMLVGLRIKK